MKNKSLIKPPRLADKLFEWYCENASIEDLHGDMEELFCSNLEKMSLGKAKFKYWLQVFSLMFSYAIKKRKKKSPYSLNSYPSNNLVMIRNYFKVSLRNLMKSKGYSFINVGGLAIGITVTMLIALWIYDELSYDTYNPNYDRVAQVVQNVTNNGEISTWMNQPYPLAEELRTNYGGDFKHIAMAVQWGDHMLNHKDKTLKVVGSYFEKDAPDILALTLLQGSSNMIDPTSILLSSSTAKTYFGEGDPINKLMKIDEMPLVKVIGIYQDFPSNSRFTGLNFIASWEFLYSNDNGFKNMEDPWRPNFTTLFVELNDNVDFSSVSAKIKDAKLKKINEHLAKKKPELFLHPMSQWHLFSEFKNGKNTGGAIQYVWMFAIIGTFVLLLACINFMNLSTARNERRAKEVGIRKTVGSLKSQLISQFFTESFLTVLLAFMLSSLLVQLVLPFFNEVANKKMTLEWSNPFLWVISSSFILFTALLAGSYPAFYLSSFKPVSVLKGTFKAGRFAAVPRKILVTFQFTVSVTLITGTIIIYQQIQFAQNRPVGYSRENLVSIPSLNSIIHEHFDGVKNELLQTGIATSVAESQSPPTAIWNSTSGLSWQGKDPSLSVDFGFVFGSYDFGKTIGWHIKEGRDFSKEFASDSSALILNEAAIKFMNIKNPVGQPATWFGQPFTIIGVIEDMVMESPYYESRPVIYGNLTGQGDMMIVKLNPSISAKESLAKMESIFKRINPEQPFEYQFVDDEYATKFGNEERIGKLSSIFAILAVLISCLGIFGLASFTAEQRTKEIGVRKVMGASIFTLWKMLSKDFILLVIASVFMSTPIAYYFMNDWLQKYEYRTGISWWIFAASGLGAVLITLCTVSYQSIKAALVNPVKSLRSE